MSAGHSLRLNGKASGGALLYDVAGIDVCSRFTKSSLVDPTSDTKLCVSIVLRKVRRGVFPRPLYATGTQRTLEPERSAIASDKQAASAVGGERRGGTAAKMSHFSLYVRYNTDSSSPWKKTKKESNHPACRRRRGHQHPGSLVPSPEFPKMEGDSGGRQEPKTDYGARGPIHGRPGPSSAGTHRTGSQHVRRSFTIDYDKSVFLKDGKPFRYIAGAMHYFRVPSPLWADRLSKFKAGGLNAVETYVEWSGHEPEPGLFNFRGDYDLLKFFRTAQDVGLPLILRPGPYICAERDNGGLPYWLLKLNGGMKLRTSDKSYLKKVDRWFGVLLPMVEPFLYENGGPIIMVQVESEYGSHWACDREYMTHLVDVFKTHLGNRVPLFTTDAPRERILRCGSVEGALATVSFGGGQDVENAFDVARKANGGKGPLAVNEFYIGSYEIWGRDHGKFNTRATLKTLDEVLKRNASLTLHMFHGGTNFGFSSGAHARPLSTSYDYGAPLSEAGDPRDLYFQIRKLIFKYEKTPMSPLPEDPKPAPKLNYGEVKLSCGFSLEDVMDHFRKQKMLKTATSNSPMSFEDLGQDYGYVAYRTVVPFECAKMCNLRIHWYSDRAYVISGNVSRVIDYGGRDAVIPATRGTTLTIFVENTGRINPEKEFVEKKGILSFVMLDARLLGPWIMEAVPITKGKDIGELLALINGTRRIPRKNCGVPGFYFGRFTLPEGQRLLDTFLDPTGWTKGVAFVNGFNLGRYWPVVGPQVTLYVPRTVLRPYPEENNLVLLEMEGVDHPAVNLTDVPNIDGRTRKPASAIGRN